MEIIKKVVATIGVIAFVFAIGCSNTAGNDNEQMPNNTEIATLEETQLTEKADDKMTVEINGSSFEIELYNNATVVSFQKRLPLSLDMEDLHSNEKYCYLESSLPAKAEAVNKINVGDVMLFGNDCLVVFYKSFSTSYSYTKIGHITDTTGLEEAVGSGDVNMTFS